MIISGSLLFTSGGSHAGEAWRRTGYCGLGAAVQTLGLQHEGPLEIDFVVSVPGRVDQANTSWFPGSNSLL